MRAFAVGGAFRLSGRRLCGLCTRKDVEFANYFLLAFGLWLQALGFRLQASGFRLQGFVLGIQA